MRWLPRILLLCMALPVGMVASGGCGPGRKCPPGDHPWQCLVNLAGSPPCRFGCGMKAPMGDVQVPCAKDGNEAALLAIAQVQATGTRTVSAG
jgi:hypothetical protein